MFGLKCVIYMGAVDCERQALNVYRMKMLGAEVVPVQAGQKTLKEAVNEAMRDWVTNVRSTHYILGTAYGAHPYPVMVRNFQRIIGDEARAQILEKEERLPDLLIACVGGGSNAIGLVLSVPRGPIREDGRRGSRRTAASSRSSTRRGFRAARSACCKARAATFCRTNTARSNPPTASAPDWITPPWGRNTPGCATPSRVEYTYATDDQALEAFMKLARLEGIIPALESAHAVAEVHRARAENGQGRAHHRESLRPRRQRRGASGGEGEVGNAEIILPQKSKSKENRNSKLALTDRTVPN